MFGIPRGVQTWEGRLQELRAACCERRVENVHSAHLSPPGPLPPTPPAPPPPPQPPVLRAAPVPLHNITASSAVSPSVPRLPHPSCLSAAGSRTALSPSAITVSMASVMGCQRCYHTTCLALGRPPRVGRRAGRAAGRLRPLQISPATTAAAAAALPLRG